MYTIQTKFKLADTAKKYKQPVVSSKAAFEAVRVTGCVHVYKSWGCSMGLKVELDTRADMANTLVGGILAVVDDILVVLGGVLVVVGHFLSVDDIRRVVSTLDVTNGSKRVF